MVVIDPTTVPAWQHLEGLAATVGTTSIRDLMRSGDRSWMMTSAAGLILDFSRQRLDREVFDALMSLATEVQLPELRRAMFDGSHINTTEDRAVGHVALRAPRGSTFNIDGVDVVPDVHRVLDEMADFARGVRNGSIVGTTGKPFRSVVNIGIGGSDLGPAMAYEALRAYADPNIAMSFVSNVDPTDLAQVLSHCDPETTLFLVSSKTFTTSETMLNAQSAKSWLIKTLGERAVAQHMVAISTNHRAIAEFGIERSLGFWDWVGGRYSMDSAIGLSTMIAIGDEGFRDMLDGMHAMDVHFRDAPDQANLPVVMGLIDVWNRTFLNIPSVAVLPYAQALRRFPAYLQQLVMESNGKSVRRDGVPVAYETGAVYWGEPGTNGQHSFYQLLHQGTSDVACQIVCFAQNANERGEQHDVLVANALAQAAVLANGRAQSEIPDGSPHKVMPGNRPTSVIWGQKLDPPTFGALVSAFEHTVFVQGAVWGINSFDQWGVELGKVVANTILQGFTESSSSGLDDATQRSIALYNNLRHG